MSWSYRGSNKVVVGITSRSSEKDLQWLMEYIRQTFSEIVFDVKYLPITNSNTLEWEKKVRSCAVGILYHTKRQGRINIVDVDGALYDEELEYLSDILGKSKVLVVLDDLENCSDSERERILGRQPSLKHRASQLLLFPEKDKSKEANQKIAEFLKVLDSNASAVDPPTNTTKSKGNVSFYSFPSTFTRDKISKTISDSEQTMKSNVFKPRRKIGIFSRSAQSNYEWLMDWLRNSYRADDVHGVYITNNYTNFYPELSKCSFAILYHTKKQGRLNLTDVTDSLYDEQLGELFRFLGKENVIVVIDDLQNISTAEKERILRGQPSISRLAQDLFLFKDKEKNYENLTRIKEIFNGTGSENFNNKDMKIVVDDRSELLRKDSSLQPKGSVSGNTKRYESTGPVPSAYSSSPSTNYYPNSNVDVQPSSSGVNHKERSLQDHTKNRSSDHSDEFEEPAHKKPFLKTNLAQTNIFQFASDTLEDLCTKGAPFLEIFNMINKRRLLFTQQINEIQKQMQEMEETIRMKEEKIKDQQRTISNRDNTIRLMRSDQELKECEIRKLPSKIEDNGIEGEKKEQKLQKQELVIADLQTNIAEMKLEIQKLEERLQREDQKIHGQMNTMRQRGENIKSRSVSSMDPEEHPRMDEDSGTDQEEGSADSAHARQDKAETRELRAKRRRIQELEEKLENIKLDHKKELKKTKLDYEEKLESTKLDYEEQLKKTKLVHKKELENTKLDYEEQLEKTKLDYEEQLKKTKLDYEEKLKSSELNYQEVLNSVLDSK